VPVAQGRRSIPQAVRPGGRPPSGLPCVG